ncbi:hypothetical protein K2173_000968 [Erythroxylum novogranatense]|uniref:Aminotransferase class V domain-containing protein n=1 Tax=Erythroxylum novogranatense TaxID=1862640 RepID=A0AAV8TSM5_9ROSI|nr:hypothetical protein K2173_000968 [Erythroxylum novogranatense]
MEVKQPFQRPTPSIYTNGTSSPARTSRTASQSSSDDVVHHTHSESFGALAESIVPDQANSSSDRKLSWLRSQIIGSEVEFDTPFGKRRLTYADHTASGRSLLYVESFIMNKVHPFYGNTHTGDSYVGHQTTKMVHVASQYIKKCLGGKEDDAIIFCGSGTTAAIKRLQEVMGISVPSTMRDRVLRCLRNDERWIVFVGPYEHHSNILSWRQSLAEVVEIGLDDSGLIDLEALRKELQSHKYSNRPILGSFSACSNVTGTFSDTRAIARLLHEHGAFACFDFAASGPYVEIDIKSGEIDGYDAIFLSPHKFLGGPGTPGILLMNKVLYRLRSSPPSTCGGGTVNYVNGFNEKDTLYLNEIEERENGGTPQIIQTIRAALAFWVKTYITYHVIERQEDIYTRRALERLGSNKNIDILGNTKVKRQAIVSFLIYTTTNSVEEGDSDGEEIGFYLWGETGKKRDKPLHGPFVAVLLNDLFGVQARGGCACAGPYGHSLLNVNQTTSLNIKSAIEQGYSGVKPGWTRISFPYYMSNEEFEFVLAAVEFLATYGQRFLPLYRFNWKSGSWTFKKKALYKDQYSEFAGGNLVPLAGLMEAIRSRDGDSITQNSTKYSNQSEIMIGKYESYMQIAKCIASLLPKFPSGRTLPNDLDLNLVYFKV